MINYGIFIIFYKKKIKHQILKIFNLKHCCQERKLADPYQFTTYPGKSLPVQSLWLRWYQNRFLPETYASHAPTQDHSLPLHQMRFWDDKKRLLKFSFWQEPPRIQGILVQILPLPSQLLLQSQETHAKKTFLIFEDILFYWIIVEFMLIYHRKMVLFVYFYLL